MTHRLMPAPDVMRAEVLNATCHEYHVHHKQLMAYAHCLKVGQGSADTRPAGRCVQLTSPCRSCPFWLRYTACMFGWSQQSDPSSMPPPFSPWHCASPVQDYGSNHQWMGFIDADEFVVLTDGTPDLPTLLRDYEAHGALALNWRMFGSSEWEGWQAMRA